MHVQTHPLTHSNPLYQLLRPSPQAASVCLDLSAALEVFDKDSDGQIETHEFEEGLRKLGYNLSRSTVAHLAAMVDADGSGTIDYGEFVKFGSWWGGRGWEGGEGRGG
jgi:Ca2+-binding protein (EF-Hand superfamily)